MSKNKITPPSALDNPLRDWLRASRVFTTLKLTDGRTAVVHEVTGYHVFVASERSHGNMGTLPYYILMEVTKIDGKFIDSPDELKGYLSGDLMGIMEHISTQLITLPKL